jgi:hypothetical protein
LIHTVDESAQLLERRLPPLLALCKQRLDKQASYLGIGGDLWQPLSQIAKQRIRVVVLRSFLR